MALLNTTTGHRDMPAISRSTLYNQARRGLISRVSPGMFVDAAAVPSEANIMQWLNKKQPQAIMNLVSALSFHEATTQIPQFLSIALPRGVWFSASNTLPIKAWFVTPRLLENCFQEHHGDYGSYKVTTLERTLVDCFKYRNKIGLDIFIEALEMSRRRVNLNTLSNESIRLRVHDQIEPYIHALF